MGLESFTDWRGDPVDKAKHGGHIAASFINTKAGMTSMTSVPNFLMLVTYLHNVMHMAIAKTSTTMVNFYGTTCAFALVGGFLSDSYINRFKTILIFSPLQFLAYGLLAIGAHFGSLHPRECDVERANCEAVHGLKSVLLYATLYIMALGEGGLRANIASFGGDQFDDDDPAEMRQKSSFFNWYTFSLSMGTFAGLILVVWAEDNKGWVFGFILSASLTLVGVLVIVSGFPFYRIQRPSGSPLTRILQVFLVAFRKRKLTLPENEAELHREQLKEDKVGGEVLPHTKGFKFLDKAAMYDGNAGNWSLCTVTQVEETKIVFRLAPIFISAVLTYISIPLLVTFTIQQGATMNKKLGTIRISPAVLFTIPVMLQMIILPAYDRLFVPFARRLTGYKNGITPLQRVGVGFIANSLATLVAGLIERKRKSIAEEHGLMDARTGLPMSMFWLGAQFFFLAIVDATAFTGLLEFFNTEVSRGMKSLGTAIFWCIQGLGSFLGTTLVNIVNDTTSHGNGKKIGWLGGNNLNRNHLDRFYWLLSVLGLVSFLNYLFWARRYVYRINPVIVSD
ncbi:protein NRT1/ PTR FAMILY 4.6-like [Aristolochia californica]|uniref:protein NRT1/ PTR FAMILY 4.6-like n=1 Tax=Aristolochia californica TaxID=171875 RepID=UPI0035E2CC29